MFNFDTKDLPAIFDGAKISYDFPITGSCIESINNQDHKCKVWNPKPGEEVFYPGVGVTFDRPLPAGHYHVTETTHPSGGAGWTSYRLVSCSLSFREDMNPPGTYFNRCVNVPSGATSISFEQNIPSGCNTTFGSGHPRHISHMGLYEGDAYWSSTVPSGCVSSMELDWFYKPSLGPVCSGDPNKIYCDYTYSPWMHAGT